MLTLKRLLQPILVPLLATTALHGCSTAEVAPDASVMPEVPDYVKVPHPVGYEIAEIRALFENPLAPKNGLGIFTDTCDQSFRALAAATSVKEDRRQGAVELVTLNAEKMHWCFYGKVERMQNNLRTEQSWSARQKIVLDSFEFLAPIANAFLNVYHDSRYMRWATQYYSNISEWIFFRKVVPGPENTLALTMSATTDLEAWTTENAKSKLKSSVFSRYGIAVNSDLESTAPPAAPAPAPVAPVAAAPAPTAAPEALPEPALNVAPVKSDTVSVGPVFGGPAEAEPNAPMIAPEATKPGMGKQVADQPLSPLQAPASQSAPRKPANEVKPEKTKLPVVEEDTPFGL